MRSFMLILTILCSCYAFLGVLGDVGTATSYDPPYLPTKCKGYDQTQFPEGGFFVAASEGLWDNGAACGRRYRMRCISGQRRPCKDGFIAVNVVDLCRTSPCPATLLLSNKAFNAISKYPNAKINVEYAQ
ncbi:EG45-like domain containing protein [Punica granatum]|uniref:EG45-like domain containing protein n=1 Tax=Punica granatum TaxID=22663 RepID=A0A6P8BSW9_PUNGR|nr:EG45-like domain containing protein [Punica granatum]